MKEYGGWKMKKARSRRWRRNTDVMKKLVLFLLSGIILTACTPPIDIEEGGETNMDQDKMDYTDENIISEVEVEKSAEEKKKDNERRLSLELNSEEKKRKAQILSEMQQYEINILLDVLDIREWQWPPYADDEADLPVDDPLGCYTEEALEPYLKSEEAEVKIEYYFGGHRPSRPEEKMPIQTVKINMSGKATGFGYARWAWWGKRVYETESYKTDQMVAWKPRKGKKIERQSGQKDYVLGLDNLEEVMKTFATIKDEDDLYKLEDLPLTENFYNQCMEAFPYAVEIERMRSFWFGFYGIGDDSKFVCHYTLSPNTDDSSWYSGERDEYFVEMIIKDGQIDAMDIMLLKRHPSGNN